MTTFANYWLIWGIYLAASAIFFLAFWRITRFPNALWLSYLVRALMIAIVFTPWYANQQETVLAPALIVIALDAITIGGSAAVRGLVPLVLAIIFALVVGGISYLIAVYKNKSNNKGKNIKQNRIKKSLKSR